MFLYHPHIMQFIKKHTKRHKETTETPNNTNSILDLHTRHLSRLTINRLLFHIHIHHRHHKQLAVSQIISCAIFLLDIFRKFIFILLKLFCIGQQILVSCKPVVQQVACSAPPSYPAAYAPQSYPQHSYRAAYEMENELLGEQQHQIPHHQITHFAPSEHHLHEQDKQHAQPNHLPSEQHLHEQDKQHAQPNHLPKTIEPETHSMEKPKMNSPTTSEHEEKTMHTDNITPKALSKTTEVEKPTEMSKTVKEEETAKSTEHSHPDKTVGMENEMMNNGQMPNNQQSMGHNMQMESANQHNLQQMSPMQPQHFGISPMQFNQQHLQQQQPMFMPQQFNNPNMMPQQMQMDMLPQQMQTHFIPQQMQMPQQFHMMPQQIQSQMIPQQMHMMVQSSGGSPMQPMHEQMQMN